jgi:hypothetical protein
VKYIKQQHTVTPVCVQFALRGCGLGFVKIALADGVPSVRTPNWYVTALQRLYAHRNAKARLALLTTLAPLLLVLLFTHCVTRQHLHGMQVLPVPQTYGYKGPETLHKWQQMHIYFFT